MAKLRAPADPSSPAYKMRRVNLHKLVIAIPHATCLTHDDWSTEIIGPLKSSGDPSDFGEADVDDAIIMLAWIEAAGLSEKNMPYTIGLLKRCLPREDSNA